MQTKKRAKPVKFGKSKEKEEKITREVAEADINSDEAKEIKHLIEEKTHPKDDDPEETEGKEEEATFDEEKENEDTEDLEDVREKEEEKSGDEPEEVKLSEELDENKDDNESKDVTEEEKFALETTEPALEVAPDELQEKEKEEDSEKEDEQSSQFGSFTKEAVVNKRKKSNFGFFLLIATITFLVGLLIIGGLSYFLSTNSDDTMKLPSFQAATPTPTTEPTATPTPEEVDLSAYSIRVLNGSGITGEAASARTLLEAKGFDISGVGNASTSDYTTTVISATEDVDEAYLNELIKALQENYKVNSVVEDAPSSQTADVVVTVGSESAE